ncbi:hypothetical protein L1275_002431 [Flavobacterium sp. HSC-61S13]|nr:hypothetical protein [Flavobacterium sp. HSC-61S13]
MTKSHNHDHFWIEDEILYESYRTIRGLRYRQIMEVLGLKNCERCSEEILQQLSKTSHYNL